MKIIVKTEYELAVENGNKYQWKGKWIGCNKWQMYTACLEGAKAGYNRIAIDYDGHKSEKYKRMIEQSTNQHGLVCCMFLSFHFHNASQKCEPHARLMMLDREVVDIPLAQWKILYGYE